MSKRLCAMSLFNKSYSLNRTTYLFQLFVQLCVFIAKKIKSFIFCVIYKTKFSEMTVVVHLLEYTICLSYNFFEKNLTTYSDAKSQGL